MTTLTHKARRHTVPAEFPAAGRYLALDNPTEWRAGTISRADVAAFLVAEIRNSRHLGRTPVLIS